MRRAPRQLRRAQRRHDRAAGNVAHWQAELDALRAQRAAQALVPDEIYSQGERRREAALADAQQRLSDARWSLIVAQLKAA